MILKREVKRFNVLLELIRHSLSDLKHGINGTAIADQYFSETVSEIANNRIPSIWLKRSYLSAKPLASYLDDLTKRIEFFQSWNRFGTPQAFWFSAFYFPQALITTIRQNYAKQLGLDFDDVDVKIEITSFDTIQSNEFETFMKVCVDFLEISNRFIISTTISLVRLQGVKQQQKHSIAIYVRINGFFTIFQFAFKLKCVKLIPVPTAWPGTSSFTWK